MSLFRVTDSRPPGSMTTEKSIRTTDEFEEVTERSTTTEEPEEPREITEEEMRRILMTTPEVDREREKGRGFEEFEMDQPQQQRQREQQQDEVMEEGEEEVIEEEETTTAATRSRFKYVTKRPRTY